MANVETLNVAAWYMKAEDLAQRRLLMTCFKMPLAAHETLVEWCRRDTGRTADVPTSIATAGLPEILSFFAPEAAYMGQDRDERVGPRRQCFYFMGDVTGDHELRKRMRAALSMWLGIVHANKAADARIGVAEAAMDSANWAVRTVSTELANHGAVCAAAQDVILYDALVAHVAAALEGQGLRFESGETRTLIRQTPRSQVFDGIELVAFPPKKERGGEGLYTEVVTVTTANFPEQRHLGIQVLARPSIRNWGPIERHDRAGSPTRSLDVFMPPQSGDIDFSQYRHTSFGFKVIVENWHEVIRNNEDKAVKVRWESHRDSRIFDLIARLTSNPALGGTDQTRPVVTEHGLWVLPRLAPGSRDSDLAGGSGVGWHDRHDIAKSLDEPLRAAGFERSPPMTRITRPMPISVPFRWSAKDLEQRAPVRRESIIKALEAMGNSERTLDFFVLHRHNASPHCVREEICSYLGQPENRSDQWLEWQDGLKIRLVPADPGPLSELLPFSELSDEDRAGLTKAQQEELARVRRARELEAVAVDMSRHIRQLRQGRTTVACAVLEMAEGFLSQPYRDPFVLSRRSLAEHRVLPQVILVNNTDAPEHKYRAAVRDSIRMLGAVPVVEEQIPFAPAALTVIQRNDSKVGGGKIETQAFPIALRTSNGILECAIPDDGGEPAWMPYGVAALRIYAGDYGRFGRNGREENRRKFEVFFATVLEQIDRRGPAVVLGDQETLNRWIPHFRNANLVFDTLTIGNRRFTANDLPNTRIVRIYSDAAKLPSYFQAEAQWPTGLFGWGDAKRTSYGVKKKPLSAKYSGRYSLLSRHLPADSSESLDSKPRRIAALDEICAVFKQPDDDPVGLMTVTHRLRGMHTQYDDDTRLPFPLHEGRLLGGAVTA